MGQGTGPSNARVRAWRPRAAALAHAAPGQTSAAALTVAASPSPLTDLGFTIDGSPKRARLIALLEEVRLASLGRRPELVAERLADFADGAALASLKALHSDVSTYLAWCRAGQLVGLPAVPGVLVAYLQARAEAGRSVVSLDRALASLASLHRLLGWEDPTKHADIASRRKALRRKQAEAGRGRQRQALGLRFKGNVADPLTDAPRGVNLFTLLNACADDIYGLRDRALLSVAFDTALRASELLRARADHVVAAADGAGALYLPTTKTDPDGQGAYAYLSPRSMLALEAWADAREALSYPRKLMDQLARDPALAATMRGQLAPHTAYLFPALWTTPVKRWVATPSAPIRVRTPEGGSLLVTPPPRVHIEPAVVQVRSAEPMTPDMLRRLLKQRIARAHEQKLFPDLTDAEVAQTIKRISGHSMRVGAIQEMFAAGEELGAIQQAVRHKSARVTLRYAEHLTASANAAARVMGKL